MSDPVPARCEVLNLTGQVIATAAVVIKSGIRCVSVPPGAVEEMVALRSIAADGSVIEIIELAERRTEAEAAEALMLGLIDRLRDLPPIDV